MNLVAIRMLLGDGAKYLTLVCGLGFATFLMLNQGGIFFGLMDRSGAAITNIPEVDVWVTHPNTPQYDQRYPIMDVALQRTRGVNGVAWAVPLYVSGASARFHDGSFAGITIIGIDRASRVGLPHSFETGGPDQLNDPDAIYWDNLNLDVYKRMLKTGDVFEINDRRARVAGIVTPPLSFSGMPTVYTTYERAQAYSPPGRDGLTYVLVKVQGGADVDEVAKRISEATGLEAVRSDEFAQRTKDFYMYEGGIAFNFGFTVFLGALVGVAVSAQTFYTFVLENAKNFATFKAMGLGRKELVRMVLLQALFVGLVGWGLGAGLAALFGWNIGPRSVMAFELSQPLLWGSMAAMVLTSLFAALIAIWRVLKIEPALVFR